MSCKELTLQGVPISFLAVVPDYSPTPPPLAFPALERQESPHLLDQVHIILPSGAARFPLLKLSGPTFRQSGVIVHGAPVANDGAPLLGGRRSFWHGWGRA